MKGITTLRLVRWFRSDFLLCALALLLWGPRADLFAADPAPPSGPVQATTDANAASPSARTAVSRFFDNRLSPYEPIYFILGEHPSVKFQFSLKFQLIDTTERPLTVFTNFYFAYTQTSFWDLLTADPKFIDTSYKPSLFFYFQDLFGHGGDGPVRFDLQPGVEHESNGRGGADERSQNTVYLQPTLTFGRPGNLQFALQPRAWFYFNVGNNNPDVARYRGYANLLAALTLKKSRDSWENFQITTRFQVGDEGTHPAFEVTGRYYVPHFTALQITYFNGFGQYFLQYNKRSTGLRAGLCIWYWPDFAR